MAISTILVEGRTITCYLDDGYINATQLCYAGNKLYYDWKRRRISEEFLEELSDDTSIPIYEQDQDQYMQITTLIKCIDNGPTNKSTWVHPRVAINIAQWISVKFDVKITSWIQTEIIPKVICNVPKQLPPCEPKSMTEVYCLLKIRYNKYYCIRAQRKSINMLIKKYNTTNNVTLQLVKEWDCIPNAIMLHHLIKEELSVKCTYITVNRNYIILLPTCTEDSLLRRIDKLYKTL
jgi:hypothetical protein